MSSTHMNQGQASARWRYTRVWLSVGLVMVLCSPVVWANAGKFYRGMPLPMSKQLLSSMRKSDGSRAKRKASTNGFMVKKNTENRKVINT